ncbi:MAG: hypothetical protein J4F36_12115 [Nitrosopumilaceae archaeon]|nr:hypothetical protein [Nitrosopumilaceae archaeon]
MDGLIRNNAGADIGDTITVFKATTLPAQKVTVTPLEDQDELLSGLSEWHSFD